MSWCCRVVFDIQVELAGSVRGVGEDGIAEESLGGRRVEVQSVDEGIGPD